MHMAAARLQATGTVDDAPVIIGQHPLLEQIGLPQHAAGQAHDDLLVLRTFSKLYGMAGLRQGYAIAHPETIKKMRPWVGSSGTGSLVLKSSRPRSVERFFARSSMRLA